MISKGISEKMEDIIVLILEDLCLLVCSSFISTGLCSLCGPSLICSVLSFYPFVVSLSFVAFLLSLSLCPRGDCYFSNPCFSEFPLVKRPGQPIFYDLLRPRLVHSWFQPLCSDSLSAWLKEDVRKTSKKRERSDFFILIFMLAK